MTNCITRFFSRSSKIAAGLLLIAGTSVAQDFTQMNAGLTPFAHGYSSMADYDADGDLDLVLTGIQSNSLGKATLFQNTNGIYAATGTLLEGLQKGTARWADYDRDGDLDLLLAGLADDYSRETILYFNDNGLIKPTTVRFPGFANGQAGWFDYDRDGYPDLLISGDTLSLNHFTGLYHNQGDGTFQSVPTSLPNLVSSAMAFADIDNDGDIDLALSGDSGGGDITRLYKNVDGTFVQVNTDLEGVSAGSMAFGDIENDGDMDLFYQGVNFITGTSVFWIYRNDGGDQWTKLAVGLPGLYLGGLALADFDLDGWIDFIATGKGTGCGINATVMYRNNGNGGFWQVGFDFPALANSSVSAADYDNDGDADVVLTGINGNGVPSSYLFRNDNGTNQFAQSLVPMQPENLSSEVDGTSITFKWNRPQAMRMTLNPLTYNLRVGTTPGGNEVFSSNTLNNGTPLIPGMGNVQLDTVWTINQLRDGTYYWTVQAVSPGFAASEPAPEEIVDLYTAIGNTPGNEYKLIFNRSDRSILLTSKTDNQPMTIQISNLAGQRLYSSNTLTGNRLVVPSLPPGLYVISCSLPNETVVQKILL